MNQTKVKIDDLPELPVEKIFSYLSLADRIRSRAVSRRWCRMIDSFKVKRLWLSTPSEIRYFRSPIYRYAIIQNRLISNRGKEFLVKFSQSILSNLKYLCFLDQELPIEEGTALFQTINSFTQLEELNISGTYFHRKDLKLQTRVELNLPMLKKVHLTLPHGIARLTLNAPRLQEAKLAYSYPASRAHIIHGESVERLFIASIPFEHLQVQQYKNLKCLYVNNSKMDATLLSSLEQLKEIHLYDPDDCVKLFEEKYRLDRSDLKIYLRGLLLDGPDDSVIKGASFCDGFGRPRDAFAAYWRKGRLNPTFDQSKLADQIPFYFTFTYSAIKSFAPDFQVKLLNRMTFLREIRVNVRILNIEQFLAILDGLNKIVKLNFKYFQSQELLDRLPNHCAFRAISLEQEKMMRYTNIGYPFEY